MESPSTAIFLAGSGFLAGPSATEPSAILNLLPWQGQSTVPSAILSTVHPWCVHTVEKATKLPFVGWVTTTPFLAKILPPPTGISEVLARATPTLAPLSFLPLPFPLPAAASVSLPAPASVVGSSADSAGAAVPDESP